MPYFVKIGAVKQNISGVGSKGYHHFRRGQCIITRWGAVDAVHAKFYWRGSPAEKIYTHRSEKLAQLDLQERNRVREKIEHYSRLPSGVKIRPAKRD
jgi:hypothetical protein